MNIFKRKEHKLSRFLLTKSVTDVIVEPLAEVAELADALRSGRSGYYFRKGSNPFLGT
jgi:hypothetical protein